MTEDAQTEFQKILNAFKCLRKTLRCTFCKNLPTDTTAAKCGHPFCGSCMEKILRSKKAVCSICKTIIIRSSVKKINYIDKTIGNLKMLAAAITRDTGTDCSAFNLSDRSAEEPQIVRRYRGKRKSVEAQPSTSKDETIFRHEPPMEEPKKFHRAALVPSSSVGRRRSTNSEETIKIDRTRLKDKNEEPVSVEPSESKVSDNMFHIFAREAEKLTPIERALEPNEKVDLWLSSEKFETDDGNEIDNDFPETTKQNLMPDSTSFKENPNPASQTRRQSLSLSLKSRSESPLLSNKKSRASNGASKKLQDDENCTNNASKYKSFKLGSKKKPETSIPKAVTPAEKMFDELCKAKTRNERSASVSASTEASWSELAQFGKEARPKIRKRKRLNISIGKPDTTKQTLESEEDSKEEQNFEPTDLPAVEHSGEKSTMSSAEKNVEPNSATKKIKPSIVSSRTLNKEEMINVQNLNKREVKEIIGAALTESDLDQSKNSNISPDTLALKTKKAQSSLGKSNEYNRGTGNESVPPNDREEDTTSHILENIRPQSKQSFNLSSSHPDSRLSMKSPFKPTPEKFKLSMNRQSLTPPNISPAKISPPNQPNQEAETEKILFSPVRPRNDFLRKNLSLRRSSDANGDRDKKLVSIKKLGKLVKTRSRIKFLRLGPMKPRMATNNLRNTLFPMSTCNAQTQTNFGSSPSKITLTDAQTQTSAELTNANENLNNRQKKLLGDEPQIDRKNQESQSSSVASSDFRKTEALRVSTVNSVSRTTDLSKSRETIDTIDKVNMLSPEKDSQLKYLEIESPSIAGHSLSDFNHAKEKTEEFFRPKKGSNSQNFVCSVLPEDIGEYMKEVKNYADKLLVTDSEDQDMPNESSERNKRKNAYRADKSSSAKKTSVDIASSSKMHDRVNASCSPKSMSLNKADGSINSGKKLSYASPKRKRLSGNSLDGQKKEQKPDARGIESNHADCRVSEGENLPLRITTSENGTQILQDSEASIGNSKHKVVRKLQYSQESSSSPDTRAENAGTSSRQGAFEKQKKPPDGSSGKRNFQRIRSVSSSDSESEMVVSLTTKPSGSTNSQNTLRPRVFQATSKSLLPDEEMSVEFSSNRDLPEPKRKRTVSEEQKKPPDGSSGKITFQRIRSVPSSDSESELVISLTTKPSGSTNSQNTLRPRVSQAMSKNLLPDEEMSVEFSSNRDSPEPEPKRKRTVSAHSPSDAYLHAIAANWYAELDKRAPEEIHVENSEVLGASNRHTMKKAKFEIRGSSASNSNDSLPPIDVNPAYCRAEATNTKSNSSLDKAKDRSTINAIETGRNSRPLSVAKSISEKNKESASSVHAKSINPFNYEKVDNSVARRNSRCDTSSENIELGDTLDGLVTPEKNKIPVKSRSSQLSHNSDKENEMRSSQANAKSCIERKATISRNIEKKITSSEDSNKSMKSVNLTAKSNNVSISRQDKSADERSPFDSCFDQDFLNITQEQMLLQEVEDNLFGRNSKGANIKSSQIKITEKSTAEEEEIEDAEVTLRAVEPPVNKVSGQAVRGNAITEPNDSDDSVTINEDIVENTPQKNVPPKKEFHSYADCSQRSTMSRKSFMSVDITPIAKTFGKQLQQRASEISPLVERSSSRISSIQQRGSSLSGSIHPSCHSTPKSSVSCKAASRVNPPVKIVETDEKTKPKYCFISSCLTPTEADKVKTLARRHGAEFITNFKPEVTHVIVKANESNSANKTLKYLQGIGHKKWIVSYRWVTDSINQGSMLREENYEVVDSDTLVPGAKRSRLSKQGLFEDFAFLCTDPISEITSSQMKDLLITTGGIVVQTFDELASATQKYKICLYNSNIPDKKRLGNFRKRGGILPVPFEWIFTCIGQYELTSLYSYVQPEDYELASDLQFPAELLVRVDDSDSGNEESRSDVDQ